jgi:hypothetical protein
MVSKLIAVAVTCAAVYGQEAKPVVDNEHVTVWEVTWTKGQLNPARGHDLDVAVFSPKSDGRGEEALLDGSANGPGSVIIELKYHPVSPSENKTSYPLAFPSSHVKKMLENDRFNKRDRTHTELLERGAGSAMMMELK